MSPYQIDVQIAPEFSENLSVEGIRRVAQAVLAHQGQPEGTALTIVITDDTQVHQLNRQFRGVDRPTDVLAFAAREGKESFITPEEVPLYLGDVIISYPTAQAQAAEYGHSVQRELALLIIHGCLHLLGYDHEEEKERQRMWALQEEILQGLG
ncbi:MAG: rRNA maturation RNase YbeY [Anaerolineae bacterium]|nr:rRNA maturation RNase YbeY [Anaerolineae bacterium]